MNTRTFLLSPLHPPASVLPLFGQEIWLGGKHWQLSAFSLERGAPHGSSLISEPLSFPPWLSQPFCSCQLQTLSRFPPTIYLASGSALSLHPGQRKPKLLSCSSPARKTAPAKPPLVSNLPEVVFSAFLGLP